MEINDIRNIADLYEYVKNDKIEWNKFSVKRVVQCEAELLNKRKIKGGVIRRYIEAWRNYKKIISSFRSEEFRLAISKSAQRDILNNFARYEQAYELLDSKSKLVYIYMLLFRLTGDYAFSIQVHSLNKQYFSDKIRWEGVKNIVDCGAYTGDTLSAFLQQNIEAKNYYMYELDDDNYDKALEVCKLAEDKGIKVYPTNKGVYSHSGVLYFKAAGDSSQIVDYPTETSVPVVAIDEDIHDRVDFIKMDIEGSELEAINGARETIKRDKPILAICIYHKQEDFWEIPLRIKEICPEYQKFWIEQYTRWDLETVLYAAVSDK